jgi:hypothetical protein
MSEKMTTIDLEIEDSLLFELMKRAHEADLTFNRYIQGVIDSYLDEMELGENPQTPR